MQGVHLWKSLLNLHVAMPNYFLKIIYGFFFQLLYYLLNTWGFLHQQNELPLVPERNHDC